MQKKVITSIIAAVSLLAAAPAGAQSYNTTVDLKTGVVTINGTTEKPGDVVNINVLKPGVELNTIPENESTKTSIEYAGYMTSDDKGEFDIEMKFTPTRGIYKAYINSGKGISEPVSIYFLPFSDPDSTSDFQDTIDILNGKTDFEGFKTEFLKNENNKYISMYDALESGVAGDKLINIIYASKPLDREDSVKNTRIYYKSLLAALANEEKLTVDTADFLINNIGESTYAEQYKKYIANDGAKSAFVSKMSDKSFTDADDMTNYIEDAIILAATESPNSLEDLKSLYKIYETKKNLDVDSAVNASYSAVMSKDWESVDELADEFNKERSSGSTTDKRPSGGGSSGGGGGVFSSINQPPKENEELTEIGMKFNDLNSVPWAYSAISELYSKGIVAGKTEDSFFPEASVTREEFVKLIVAMLGIDTKGVKSAGFKDVVEAEWYAPYVNSAYANGIINGISVDMFGVGEDISRQDMAVIIYNALGDKIASGGEPEFTDSEQIADYAKNAVSALSAQGIINGMPDGSFAPQQNATRAEAAVMIFRALEYLE